MSHEQLKNTSVIFIFNCIYVIFVFIFLCFNKFKEFNAWDSVQQGTIESKRIQRER